MKKAFLIGIGAAAALGLTAPLAAQSVGPDAGTLPPATDAAGSVSGTVNADPAGAAATGDAATSADTAAGSATMNTQATAGTAHAGKKHKHRNKSGDAAAGASAAGTTGQ